MNYLPPLQLQLSTAPLSEKTDYEPPCYSPSEEAPCYSVDPGPNEQLLASTSRLRRPPPTGIFTCSSNSIAIALREQEDSAVYPTYGRHGLLSGNVGLQCTEDVRSVSLKIMGRLALTVSDGASHELTFLCSTHTIWRADSTTPVCPSMLAFEVFLPRGYHEAGRARSLPPSYEGTFSGTSDMYVRCHYSLTVSVTKSSKLSIWKPQKKLVVPFLYRPRTRPCQPILPCPFPFFSSIKSLPEEWFQVVSSMEVHRNSTLEPIDCHLFIPAVQAYAVTDAVPFYLQLRARPASLHAFMHTTVPSSPKLKRSRSNLDPASKPVVRVFLLREVSAVIRGQHSCRTAVLGEGTLRSLPPGDASTSSPLRPPVDGCGTLDYEGEVKCTSDVEVASFTVGRFVVRDFIVLSLAPPNPATSPLKEHQHQHPIKLCTDSFIETTGVLDDRLVIS
ncbi:hypothetical protein BV25DRAFT_1823719 [Artomyces pyxidatus]|uniref:Uncharacterized protein n=1 Tax=Artomyces pyxidatus TaxID=48021 RepID=A0ACB8T7P1_9AGAM|nr:hypothetical protein BV25DRAFT_1823719 [Artomyces pyxidatus]